MIKRHRAILQLVKVLLCLIIMISFGTGILQLIHGKHVEAYISFIIGIMFIVPLKTASSQVKEKEDEKKYAP